jgi:hypothetical protein
MRLTTNRFLAMAFVPLFIVFGFNRVNTNQNRSALKASQQQVDQEKQAHFEALRQAHEESLKNRPKSDVDKY